MGNVLFRARVLVVQIAAGRYQLINREATWLLCRVTYRAANVRNPGLVSLATEDAEKLRLRSHLFRQRGRELSRPIGD